MAISEEQKSDPLSVHAKDKQVVSKKRVADHGEVFTAEREVNAMLDLVKNETLRIDSRFLEPACGTGNFVIEILRRKLAVVGERYSKNQSEYEKYALLAVSSIYGIDILADSLEVCRERLYSHFCDEYKSLFKEKISEDILKSAKFLLSRNIVQGDALTMKLVGSETGISFVEWSLIKDQFKGLEYRYSDIQQDIREEDSLFNYTAHTSDIGESVYITKPIKEYPLTVYGRLYELA